MKGAHKQRIVGIIVLIAVAIIIYPFFYSWDDEYDSPALTVPEPPPIPEIPFYIEEATEKPSVTQEALAEIATIGDGSILTTSSQQGEAGSHIMLPQAEIAANLEPVVSENSKTETMQEKASGPVLGSNGLPVSWSLQLAALSREENANAMADKLRAAGYQVYVKQGMVRNKMLFRIYVGPDLDRQKLEGMRANIDEQYGVDSLLVRFVP